MVLAAPAHPDARERVTPALVTRVLRTLRESFDFVVVDTAPAFDEQVLTALDETDECIIVATLDVPTLKNVKVALETLDMLDIARGHRHLLLNRADDAVGIGPEKVEAILGHADRHPGRLVDRHRRVDQLRGPDRRRRRPTTPPAPRCGSWPRPWPATRAGRAPGRHPDDRGRGRPARRRPRPGPLPDEETRMSSLSDRLAAARRRRAPTPARSPSTRPAGPSTGATQPRRRRRRRPRARARWAGARPTASSELKASVHVELVKQLGPHLYDADMDTDELDQRVRTVLADVLGPPGPAAVEQRPAAGLAGDQRRHPRLRPDRAATCATPTSPR